MGTVLQPRSPRITSTPSRSGSPRSRMTTSGCCCATASSAWRPVPAAITSYERAARLTRSARTI